MKVPKSVVQGDLVWGGRLHLLVIFSCLCLTSSASRPDFFCPDIVEIGSSAVFNCSVSHTDTTLKYEGPGGLDAPQCDLAQGRCTGFGVYSASIVNQSNTVLMINSVSQSMAGEWRCTDDARTLSSFCNLQIIKSPLCSISGGVNTDVVAAGEEVSLNVSIVSHYCSAGASNFTLQTGNTSQTLGTAVNSLGTVTVSINVTDLHYGDVRVIFACHSYQRSLLCSGITQLQKSSTASTANRGAISHSMIINMCIIIISITNSMFLGE